MHWEYVCAFLRQYETLVVDIAGKDLYGIKFTEEVTTVVLGQIAGLTRLVCACATTFLWNTEGAAARFNPNLDAKSSAKSLEQCYHMTIRQLAAQRLFGANRHERCNADPVWVFYQSLVLGYRTDCPFTTRDVTNVLHATLRPFVDNPRYRATVLLPRTEGTPDDESTHPGPVSRQVFDHLCQQLIPLAGEFTAAFSHVYSR
jgi:hypothetical protein